MEYETFFGLKDTPFRLTPDPDYFFPSEIHNEALKLLNYSVHAQEGFVQITGEPGVGKTITLRCFLHRLGDNIRTVLVLNPRLSPHELLKTILEDLGVDLSRTEGMTKEELVRLFRHILLHNSEKNIITVLVIDEAQNLPNDTLEELRLLSNLETSKKKLLLIMMVGQIELEDKLQSQDLKQLNQRITVRFRLKPLTRQETAAYIQHRLQVAGGTDNARFSGSVLNQVHKATRGIPRLINIVCERALMAAFVEGANDIEKKHLLRAVESVVGEKRPRRLFRGARFPWESVLTVLLGLFLVAGLSSAFYKFFINRPEQTEIKTAEQQAPVQDLETAEPATPPEQVQAGPAPAAITEPTGASPQPQPEPAQPQAQIVQFPPMEVYYIPVGSHFVSVDYDNRKGKIWEGAEPLPLMKLEFDWPDPPQPGVTIIGKDKNNKMFFFNYPNSFLQNLSLPDERHLIEMSRLAETDILPIISYSSTARGTIDQVKLAHGARQALNAWADAWRAKNVAGLLSFYAEPFNSYFTTKQEPDVYDRERLHQVKQDVFNRSGSISVVLSEPLCLLDPSNPGLVVTIFRQKYSSDIYSDEGVQALYFKLVQDADQGEAWKIAAKFWIPK